MHKDGYVTVMDIENYLKENDCQVGLTTIYRHLEKMEKDGIVTKFSVEGQPGACFQYIEQGENQDCFYIKCEECGEVTKMECHHLAELYSHVNQTIILVLILRKLYSMENARNAESVKKKINKIMIYESVY
mgnify:CR=1 FL=1